MPPSATAGAPRVPRGSASVEHTETNDRIGDVPAWVHDLERQWQEEEEARGRVFVSPEEAILDLAVSTRVPPQVAWEYLTKPGFSTAPADQ